MTTLRDFYPSLRTRQEVYDDILSDPHLRVQFFLWPVEEQERFLDICSGNRGLKVLYDAYFQEIFNPDVTPERLISLLSVLLNKEIVAIRSLRSQSSIIEDNQSLMVLDIVVVLNDGSIVNVEMQKIGYMFPGERACCYSSDLVLRQYGRVKSEKKRKFSYADMKPVYSIIFMEKSPEIFKAYPDHYIHRFSSKSDTGLSLSLLQNYLFIPLDIFSKVLQNKGIRNLSRLDAWLLFLSTDDPEKIYMLIEAFPEFRPMYEQIFTLCHDTGRMMDMFSKELQMIDHNTVKLMIDQMNDELEAKREQLEANREQLEESREQLEANREELEARDKMIREKDEQIQEKDEQIQEKDEQIQVKNEQLQKQNKQLQEKDAEIERLKQLLEKQGQ